MLIIPGKYIGKDGGDYTVLLTARDGESGEKTVIYRRGADSAVFTIPASVWQKGFTPVEELELNAARDAGESEIAARFASIFGGRSEACSVHWRNAFGIEGHNYLCENRALVPGCRFGTDSCKNCRSGRKMPFSPEIAAAHLRGEMLVGVYPVTERGECGFLTLEAETRAELSALGSVCRRFELPYYTESFGKRLRLWIFFASPADARAVCALGCAIITTAMDFSSAVSFSLYDKMCPHPSGIAEGSFGRPVILPLGVMKKAKSVFTDNSGKPLDGGGTELFGIRTVTKGYLSDRLNAVGNVGLGRLYAGVDRRCGFTGRIQQLPNGRLAVLKRGLKPDAAAELKRMASFRSPVEPTDEFTETLPPISVCFDEDERYIYLPHGLCVEAEELISFAAAKGGEALFLHFSEQLTDAALEAVRTLTSHRGGILLGRQGSGKTAVVGGIINTLRLPTLILVSDEAARLRWCENIYRMFGTDAERGGSKIAVRLITDEKIKDKYRLMILADCSRLPMDGEIFRRVNSFSCEYVYGITADDSRRDGLWGYLHMLCGAVVYRL